MSHSYPTQTDPIKIGAPLPPEIERLGLSAPTGGEVRNELLRAEVELMYAIAMHRKSWSKMRKWSEHRQEAANRPGGLAAMESDPVWKKRTGDVTWWRGEMDARANVVTALTTMLDRKQ